MDDSDSESSSEENITTLNIKLRDIEDDKDEVYPSFLLSMLLETSVGLVSIY